MTKTTTLLVATAALTAALGLPAWSAMHAPAPTEGVSPIAALLGAVEDSHPLILVDDDDDEGGSVTRGESEDDDGACDDDDGGCGAGPAAPAPVGSVAPPQNGLFGNGTPKVQVK